MSLSILRKPTISSAIAFVFVIIAFFLGYGFDKLPKPKTDPEKTIYTTLYAMALPLISWSVISAIVGAAIEQQAEDKGKEEAKREIDKYHVGYSKKLESITNILKGANLTEDIRNQCLNEINQMEFLSNSYWKRYDAAQKVIKWLDVDRKRRNLATRAVFYTFSLSNQQPTRKQKDLFRSDIVNCLNWLQSSLDDKLRSAPWSQADLASAMSQNLQGGLALYKSALNYIKDESEELKKLDDGTGVVTEFVDELIKLYDKHLTDKNHPG
jgi:hypothetical protein